ncbi:MAG: hypothetical protein APR54_12575 [Candidatus Cloacimonas sp. SDB]|nr:MAG: hypothetical protein APR54_12575 [Candidatus Cloacimonas sp. SDB]
MKKIIETKIDENGSIKEVRFSGNSSFTDIETAIRMTKNGLVSGTHVVNLKDGSKFLRSNPDERKKNNLKGMVKK